MWIFFCFLFLSSDPCFFDHSIAVHFVVIRGHLLFASLVVLVEVLLRVVCLGNLVLAHLVGHVRALILHIVFWLLSFCVCSWTKANQDLA